MKKLPDNDTLNYEVFGPGERKFLSRILTFLTDHNLNKYSILNRLQYFQSPLKL